MSEDQKPKTPEEAKEKVASLLSVAENKICFDCPTRNPTWASLTYAVFLCETCCGRHRGMGTHISFMRSVRLDSWEPEQAHRMTLGGNGPARKFFKSHGIMDVVDKYKTSAAQQYRKQLDKQVKGKGAHWDHIKPESPASSSPVPASPTTPEEPADSGVSSPVNLQAEAASAGSAGPRRPNLGSKKKGKGLGGAKKVEASELQLAKPGQTAVPEEFRQPKKPKDDDDDAPAHADPVGTSDDPYASLSTRGNSSSANYESLATDKAKDYQAPAAKGRFYGLGSQGNAVRNDTINPAAPPASTVHVPAARTTSGPDYTGFGSTPAPTGDQGMDVSEALYNAGEKLSKAKEWLGAKSDAFGGVMKNFLDEL